MSSSNNLYIYCGGKDVGCEYKCNNINEKEAHEKGCFYFLGRTVLLDYKKENQELNEKINKLKEELNSLKVTRDTLLAKIKDLESGEFLIKVESLKVCIEKKLCVNASVETDRSKYKFYMCKTCDMTKIRNSLICQVCAENCHKGHMIYEVPSIITNNSICSCSTQTQHCNCSIIKQNRPVRPIDIDTRDLKLEDCYNLLLCTKRGGDGYHTQMFYECYTCGMYGTKGCCLSCSLFCHKGHELKKSYNVYSFECDCSTMSVCKS